METDKPKRKPLNVNKSSFDSFTVSYKVREMVEPWKGIKIAVDVVLDHTSMWSLIDATVRIALQKETARLKQMGSDVALRKPVHTHCVTRHKVDKNNLRQLLEGLPADLKEKLRQVLGQQQK